MSPTHLSRLTGALSGLVSGLFGGGGGMIFVPLQSRFGRLPPRRLYATCVGVIFPVSLVSAVLYLWKTDLSLALALPYLLGGTLGGAIGGLLYHRVDPTWLRRIFAVFLLYAGVKYLL